MTRRLLLLGSLAPLLPGADSAQQVWDLFTDMAGSLSAANAQRFLTAFDKSMPGYDRLNANVTALLRQSEIQSSVEFTSNEGDDQKREVEADWLLILRPLDSSAFTKTGEHETMASERREQTLKCKLARQGKQWKIVALEPVDFFAPPPEK